MACACLGCTNKRSYYLWLRDTVEESGMKIPGSLQFDPWSVSNTKLDSAINRMLKLYRKAIVQMYDVDSTYTDDSRFQEILDRQVFEMLNKTSESVD